MHIDKNAIEQARNADMPAFLERHCGFTFVQRYGAYRCRQHQSLAVKNDLHSWYWHSKGVGGYGAIDYLMKIENVPFREAIDIMKRHIDIPAAPYISSGLRSVCSEPERSKELVLPEKTGASIRLYDYLCGKRGIDVGIINLLIQKEMIYEDRRGNIVFVGYDEQYKPRFASVRGTYGNRVFRMDCSGSDKRYGFNLSYSASERLYTFESPIDAISHASLINAYTGNPEAWKWHSRLSLAGTTDAALPLYLKHHAHTRELVFCLDNDPTGRDAANALAVKYANKGYATRIKLPKAKDFNDDLINLIQKKQLDATHQRGDRY